MRCKDRDHNVSFFLMLMLKPFTTRQPSEERRFSCEDGDDELISDEDNDDRTFQRRGTAATYLRGARRFVQQLICQLSKRPTLETPKCPEIPRLMMMMIIIINNNNTITINQFPQKRSSGALCVLAG